MGIKKYKMIEPPMDVVTVTLPTSDTKKFLVVILHVPVQGVKIVHRKCTEGAQQSLLYVHTLNVGVHPCFGLFRGNVTVTTPVLNCLPSKTNMNRLLNNWLLLGFNCPTSIGSCCCSSLTRVAVGVGVVWVLTY